jgi:predicted RNA-binding Zn ribbon-like protein
MVRTKMTDKKDSSAGTPLCLDFANTLSWRGRKHPEDHIESYRDLVMWSHGVNILTRRQAKQLLDESRQRRSAAEAIFDRAIRLREVVYRVFSSMSRQSITGSRDLAALNEELSNVLTKMQITQSAHGYVLTFEAEETALDQMLWPITRSVADLLTSDRLDRIRRCADEDCRWLFVDMSRNRSRRWCNMQDCGNRAKARRHYLRKHAISRRKTIHKIKPHSI